MNTRPKPSRDHRLTSVKLHMPVHEHGKPEMVRFIQGKDKRRRVHLEDTALALAEAEDKGRQIERSFLLRQLANASRLHMVWGMLAFWASDAQRSIEWDRRKRRRRDKIQKPYDRDKQPFDGYTVWALELDNTIATAQGKDPNQAAERLAVKLGLVEEGERL